MRLKLTPAFVDRAKALPGAERTVYWDESLSGFGLMVTRAGHRSFVAQYRANGLSRRYTLKDVLSLKEARKEARAVLGSVARGHDPVAERRREAMEATNTLTAIAEDYLAREAKRLRSIAERRRIFQRYIYPKLGARQIDSIRRSDIIRLLDRIEDESGPAMADYVLAMLRRLMGWHASRDDEFRSPIVRGMARTKPRERARQRMLSDDELRAVWRAAETAGTAYGHLLRFILLTATRLREAANMRRDEILPGGDWLIPGSRYKNKRDFLLPLSDAAKAALAQVPQIGRKGWVFSTDGQTPISGFSKFKERFDEKILAVRRKADPKAEPLPNWVVHDLRRTARSLMSRAGVDPDHAERARGHTIAGIRGTYDLHQYRDEKKRAFEALATQVERIVNPQPNVVPLRS
jgi:Arm DNA-binding domain/Phage integrase family/Phage integrase central domain